MISLVSGIFLPHYDPIILLNGDQVLLTASWHQKTTAEELTKALKIVAKRIPLG